METKKNEILVILPTIRGPNFIKKYIENAKLHNFDLSRIKFMVLTEDHINKKQYESVLRETDLVLNQQDRDKLMREYGVEEYSDIYPKKHRAEESFGLLYMWMNKELTYGFTIDDDTLPEDNFDFFGQHIKNLNYRGEISELSSDKGFVNVLNHSFSRYGLYPRGYPYGAAHEKITKERVTINGEVAISQGLWSNIPDLDAVRILFDGDLNGQSKTRFKITDYAKDNFTIKKENYTTVCSMNLAFRRDIIPAFYQYKMGENQWKVDRFDDIWSGIVAKKFIDSKGLRIINGSPICIHNKAPRSTFKDLTFEVAGVTANENFYKIIESVDLTDVKDDFEKIYKIAKKMKTSESEHPFVRQCGNDLERWVKVLERLNS